MVCHLGDVYLTGGFSSGNEYHVCDNGDGVVCDQEFSLVGSRSCGLCMPLVGVVMW